MEMEILLNIGNVVFVSAYFFRNVLFIRMLAILGASFLMSFFYFRPEPIMTAVYWNLFFSSVNIFWTVRLIRERGLSGVAEDALGWFETLLPRKATS